MGKTYTPLIAGSSARLLASFVTAPLELIRTRQASAVGRTGEKAGMIDEFRLLVRSKSGFRSLFSGIGPTLWRDVPFSAIYWYVEILACYNFDTLLSSDIPVKVLRRTL